MTVIVDTGVSYADHDTDASRHNAATDAVEAIYDGKFGQPYVSDYIDDDFDGVVDRIEPGSV